MLTARRFAREILHLDAPLPNVQAAIDYLGYVQIDPINVCGRMHDLILRNRVRDYREGDLMRWLHGSKETPFRPHERLAFEHHVPETSILVAFPLGAWPHLLATMHRRTKNAGAWSGRLTPREKVLTEHLLAEIASRGPLGSEDFEDDRTARRVWGAAKLVKATLQKLFFHGRLLIAQRVNHRRRYDLPERVLPASILDLAEPSPEETRRWLAQLKLRQRRLSALKKAELRAVADDVQLITISNLPAKTRCPPLYCLRGDVPQLEALQSNPLSCDPASRPELKLLAPLDPLIYDRRVTSALWSFDYTWEVYTPPAKRVRGYYALPVLAGTELVGHIDAKAERAESRLRIVSRRGRREHPVSSALQDFARWLGLRA